MTKYKIRALGTNLLIYLVLSIGALIMIIPFIWMFSTAFKTFQETLAIPIQWLPSSLQLDNFREVLDRLNFTRFYINSIIVTVSITVMQALVCTMAAYGFARIKFPGRDILFMLLLSMLMVPPQMTLLPSFLLLNNFGWIDTYQALIIPRLFSAFGTFFLRQFFLSIPAELEEAAIIDGTSRWGIYWRIFLPLSKTALAAFAVFTVLWAWNDLMWPLIMTRRESMRVLSVGISTLVGQHGTRNNWLMAASMLATAPMIILFTVLQKQFIAGITITGMKA